MNMVSTETVILQLAFKSSIWSLVKAVIIVNAFIQ